MSESSVVLTVLVVFIAGILLGRYLATRKYREAGSSPNPEADRAALARAWQSGFDTATRDAARPLPTPRQGLPGSVESAETSLAIDAGTGNDGSGPLPAPATQPAFPAGRQVPAQEISPAWMTQAAKSTHVPPKPAEPVDPRLRALRNINITLYVAALLMVAAASLFIALALPATAKVVGLGLVTAGFYVVGLVMHARSERLRPAAAAFTATGLALIPMTGLAHYLLLSTTPGTSWFVTSILGTAAFVYAGGKLQSKIIAGLAITFLVSTAYAGGAVLNRGLIYYFLFSMLLATVITLLGSRKPHWINNIYLQSFTMAHRYLVPATLVAALFSAAVLEAKDYAWLFAAAAFYYAVAVAAAPAGERFIQLAAARVSAMISVGFFLHVAEVQLTTIFRIMALILLLQLVALTLYAEGYKKWLGLGKVRVKAETWVLLGAASVSTVLGAEALLGDPLVNGGGIQLDLNWALALVLATGVFVAAKRGGHFLWAPLGIGLLSMAEPMDGNLGRQGLVLSVAVIATWLLSRSSSGVPALALRWAARLGSVLAIGDLFSLAASGWVLKTRGGSPGKSIPGADTSGELALGGAIEVATLVGVVLAVLAQVVIAVVVLRRVRNDASVNAGSSIHRLEALGESIFLAGGVLCAAVLTWMLGVSSAGMQGTLDDVDRSTGWSTVLWIGYQWDTILLWLLLLVGLLGATFVLGYRRSPGRDAIDPASRSLDGAGLVLVHVGGLLALVAALGLAVDKNPAWMVEIIAVLGLAHAGIRILAGRGVATKIGYSILAQVLFSSTAWHAAQRFDVDSHGQFALLAFTLALPQSLRVMMSMNAPARKQYDPRTVLTAAVLAVQLVIPLSYMNWYSGGYDQAGLLVQFLCLALLGALVATFRPRREGVLAYALIPAAIGVLGLVVVPALGTGLRAGGWLATPLWGKNVAGTLLVLLLIGLLVAEGRKLLGRHYRWVRVAVAILYWVGLIVLHGDSAPGWQIAAGVMAAAGFAVFAATWGIPLLLLGSAGFVFLSSLQVMVLIHDLAADRGSEPLDTMLSLGATFIVALIAALLGGRFSSVPVPWATVVKRTGGWSRAHARVLFAISLASLGLGGALGLIHDAGPYVYSGGAMFLVAAFCAAALDIPVKDRKPGYEVAALLGAAVLQRCWWVGVGEMSGFALLFYWVITLGLLAAYEFLRKRDTNGVVVLGTSAGLLSVAGVGTIISSSLAQQLVVLISFTVLLVFGLLGNRKMFTVWGGAGIAVAVLWFLRGFTFLLLLLLALGLIVLALWRLGKMNRSAPEGQIPSPAEPSMGPGHEGKTDAAPGTGTSGSGHSGEPQEMPKEAPLPWMRPGGPDA